MHPQILQLEQQFTPSRLTRIKDSLLNRYQIELWMKRDDMLHTVISGNKWRKLKFILEQALKLNTHTLVSMGGAYSNHLHALAYAGQILELRTVGLVRGERPESLNPTLTDLMSWGMKLEFVSRSEFRKLRLYKNWNEWPKLQSGEYWIPEGGASPLALKGVEELAAEIDIDYDFICAPCGTGATLAGIIAALPPGSAAIGFSALKDDGFLQRDVRLLLRERVGMLTAPGGVLQARSHKECRWEINSSYHFGGFAKTTDKLLAFIEKFECCTGIRLEPVYTGKMMYAIYDLIKQGFFSPGTRVIAVHTGGLQGNRG